MNKINDTTRKFPRTLAEAFPKDETYSNWLEEPENKISLHDKAVIWVSVILWTVLVFIFMKY